MYIDTGELLLPPQTRVTRADHQHAPGDDEWGYEDAGERWLPVHSVETVVCPRY